MIDWGKRATVSWLCNATRNEVERALQPLPAEAKQNRSAAVKTVVSTANGEHAIGERSDPVCKVSVGPLGSGGGAGA